MAQTAGTLYVVATPIGNLSDLSERAREVLEQADCVLVEDTRRTRQLLTHLGLSKRLLSVHEHNEADRVQQVMEMLVEGRQLALVSDAGTPLISDPGYRLVAAVRERNLPVLPVPGPCAAVAALSVAGLPSDRFFFEGFLPARSRARRRRLEALAAIRETLIFYESVHRIVECLEDMAKVLGPDRLALVARELTKRHETCYRGPLGELGRQLSADPGAGLGEITLVVAGSPSRDDTNRLETERVYRLLAAELPPGKAAGLTARITGARRADVYRLARLPDAE